LYLQHNLMLGNLTTNIGVRFEHETGNDGPNTRSGNPLVPLVTQSAQERVRENNFAPRLGFAWSPFYQQRLTVSGGYGRYFDQLPFPITAFETDVRGKAAPDGSIVVNDANMVLGTFDPVKNLIDPDFKATRMEEVFGGVDVGFGHHFDFGARYTQRMLQRLPVLRDLVFEGTTLRVATTGDTFSFGLLEGTDPAGHSVSIPVFAYKIGVTPYSG